jgi:hypothetical protein
MAEYLTCNAIKATFGGVVLPDITEVLIEQPCEPLTEKGLLHLRFAVGVHAGGVVVHSIGRNESRCSLAAGRAFTCTSWGAGDSIRLSNG